MRDPGERFTKAEYTSKALKVGILALLLGLYRGGTNAYKAELKVKGFLGRQMGLCIGLPCPADSL
jgi:hypothetical protein